MRRRIRKQILGLSILLFLALVSLLFLEIKLAPVIRTISESKVRLSATRIINQSVLTHVVHNTGYGEIMEIQKDREGRVVMVIPNTRKINELSAETVLSIERDFSEMKSQDFDIPLGTLSGSSLFANWGPSLPVSVFPVGAIDVRVRDEFLEAGINQTKHRIYLDISTDLQVVVPMDSTTMHLTAQVPLSESIIVGAVPEWYMNVSGVDPPVTTVPVPETKKTETRN